MKKLLECGMTEPGYASGGMMSDGGRISQIDVTDPKDITNAYRKFVNLMNKLNTEPAAGNPPHLLGVTDPLLTLINSVSAHVNYCSTFERPVPPVIQKLHRKLLTLVASLPVIVLDVMGEVDDPAEQESSNG